jgi:hypothetical protein
MNEIVHSHSGFRYADKPLSFFWDNNEYWVKQIISEWKTGSDLGFIVITKTDHAFELIYNGNADSWQVKPINR